MAVIPSNQPVLKVKPTTAVRARTAATAAAVNTALDTAGRPFAPMACRWKAEADRRHALRTDAALGQLAAANRQIRDLNAKLKRDRDHLAKVSKTDKLQVFPVVNEVGWLFAKAWRMLGSDVRTARAVVKDARHEVTEARQDRKTARQECPEPLGKRTAQAAATVAVPVTGIEVYAGMPITAALGLDAVLTVAAIGAYGLGRRHYTAAPAAHEQDGLNKAEQQIIKYLGKWHDLAEGRGLQDLDPYPHKVTDAGIRVELRLGGKWTVDEVKRSIGQARALLHVPDKVRVDVNKGGTADRAVLLFRTRSNADGMDNMWNPQREGIGFDTLTGELVDVPVTGVHSMTGGRTNMGKSAYARIQLMRTVHSTLLAGVVIDPKRAEAYAWRGKVRTAGQAADIDERDAEVYDLLKELMTEFRHRQTILDGLEWIPTPDYPELFVTFDEGAALFRMSQKTEVGEDGKPYKPYEDALEIAETLYGEARVVGMWFNWASQYLAKGTSIPQLVKENAGAVIGLTTKGQEGDRMLFGETAGQKGWTPSTACAGIPGRAMVEYRDLPPHPVQLWHVTGDMISALPDVEPWRSKAPRYGNPGNTPPAPAETAETAEAPAKLDRIEREGKILAVVREQQPVSMSRIANLTGIGKGTVRDDVIRLADVGILAKTGDGIVMGADG